MPTLFEEIGMEPNEALRQKLLKQEFKMRKKQPEAWTKTKYRPYANFRTKKKETAEATTETKTVVTAKA